MRARRRFVLKTLLAAAAAVVCALASAGAASADVSFGVADDTGKYAEDGGRAFFSTMNDVGMRENRMTVLWDPARPTTIADKPFLDRSLPQASARGIAIVFAVYPLRPVGVTETPDGAARFAAFVQLLARTYPQVKTYVIGNEPNQPRFWGPQFNPDGSGAAAATFFDVLARSYDALKAVDGSIQVVAAGISERGNDNPFAPSNASTSPVRFMRDLGATYRASGRRTPIMDQLGLHPYPESPADPLLRPYAWPSVGIASLERMKQAIWDAFHGTAQPTVEEGLRLRIGEIGWQVAVAPSAPYYGRENVPATTEERQAEIYGDLVRYVACDPHVSSLSLFGLIDERDLDRFQAGLLRADGSRRPAYETMKAAIRETGGRCAGPVRQWRHTESVVGATALFGSLKPSWTRRTSWSFSITAGEEATYRASIVRLPSKPSARRVAPRRHGGAAPQARGVLVAAGAAPAHWTPRVKFPARRLRAGTYVYLVTLRATMNPERASTFVSRPFRVGPPVRR